MTGLVRRWKTRNEAHGPQTEKMNCGTGTGSGSVILCKMALRSTGGRYSVELYTREFRGYPGSFIPTPTRSIDHWLQVVRILAMSKCFYIASHQNLAFWLGFGGYAMAVFFKDTSTPRVLLLWDSRVTCLRSNYRQFMHHRRTRKRCFLAHKLTPEDATGATGLRLDAMHGNRQQRARPNH